MFCEGNPCKRCGAATTPGFRRVCNLDWSDHDPERYAADGPEQLRGLGDYTESLLQSVGITKERYQAAKQLFGLAPTCNCDERKAWLNRVSDWWRAL